MRKTFYSNGKLLVTGEYVVLDGAKALALPTKAGQFLHVDSATGRMIFWKSFDSDGFLWYEDTLSFDQIRNNTDFGPGAPVKNTLVGILHQAYLQNPDFLNREGYTVTTNLTFPRSWGLGTSSTLINNIAQWLQIDAFELLRKSFGGSGYDIACAQHDTPIVFHLENGNPVIEAVAFHPVFSDHLYFVYLNKKQSSKSAIANYYKKQFRISDSINEINGITCEILRAESLQEFAELLQKHELMLSAILETKTVKEALFPDFTGMIKSLGAWGGDFVLAASETDPKSYFEQKGYPVVIPYDEMIK